MDTNVTAVPASGPFHRYPRIHRGIRTVLTTPRREETVYLQRAGNPPTVDRAYRKDTRREAIPLRKNGRDLGELWFGIILENFQEPTGSNVSFVAVKELRKKIVDNHLVNGGKDDPYKECSALHRIGDDYHVLRFKEVLEDDENLYLVMPYCDGDDLFNVIQADGPMQEDQARQHFREILACLDWLRQHRICHKDFSPDNIMIHENRCIVIDLGLCMRVPHMDDGGRLLIKAQRFSGKPPYMAPEVFCGDPFDGYAIDLWAAGTVLYYILTGLWLYDEPRETDFSFLFLICDRRMVDDRLSADAMFQLGFRSRRTAERVAANRLLSREAKDLLQGMLARHPSDRLNLEQVMNHPWVTH